MNDNVRNAIDENDTVESCITAKVCDQVSTVDWYSLLDRNYGQKITALWSVLKKKLPIISPTKFIHLVSVL